MTAFLALDRRGDAAADDAPHAPDGRDAMQQLIQLRWFAVGAQLATILLVHFAYGIRLPLDPMLEVLACLAAFNVASLARWRRRDRPVRDRDLFLALLVDVGSLTAQLFFSGGVANPFCFLYLLQVTLGAVVLETWSTWSLLAVATACFAGLTVSYRPLALPVPPRVGLPAAYVQGLLICFLLNAALLVATIGRANRSLRARDARLAALRQRAAEEEHIVRMGLLASGAAHELGTPLATLAVILGDWRREPVIVGAPGFEDELDEMQAQVGRCKAIVSGILLSAGEARGESSRRTTLGRFLAEVADGWRANRRPAAFEFENRFGADPAIVDDSTVKQMLDNLLDNAFEASPGWLRLEASRDGDRLVLTVADRGPGFAAGMLDGFGRPYRSSKGRPGSGLGLFLVVNVVRTLGGEVAATNREGGGAQVVVRLPLAAIRLDRGRPMTTPVDGPANAAPARRLLIVEDDAALARTLARSFERRGWRTLGATTPAEVEARLADGPAPTHAVVDLKLAGETSGLVCVQRLHAADPAMPIVVLTGFASIATAVEAIKLGACHYLAKPSNTDDIEAAFARAAGGGDAQVPLTGRPTSIKTLEWERIHQTLAETGFNISETARRLGLHRRTLARKLGKQQVK